MIQSRTNSLIPALPLVFAAAFVIGAIILAIYAFPKAKDAGVEREKKEKLEDSISKIGDMAQIEAVEIEIGIVDSSIERLGKGSMFEQSRPMNVRRAGESVKPEPVPTPKVLSSDDNAKKEELLGKRAELVARRDKLKNIVSSGFERGSWFERLGELGWTRGLFLSLGFGLLGAYCVYAGVTGRLANSNPLSISIGLRRNIAISLGVVLVTAAGFFAALMLLVS